MKISELMERLGELQAEHGDCDVCIYYRGNPPYKEPELEYHIDFVGSPYPEGIWIS